MLDNRDKPDIHDDIQSDEENLREYGYLLDEIDAEIAELSDNDINNDEFELNGCLTQGFASYLGKEKAQQWLESIKNVYCDDEMEMPEGVQELVDFLESIDEVPTNEVAADAQDPDVDVSKKYGYALDGSEYNSDNSFTSRSGITYKLYDQTKGPWAGYKYSDGKTMCHRGCMLTSAAVVASSLGNFQLTPGDLFKKHRSDFVSRSVPLMSDGKLKSDKIKNLGNVNDTIVKSLQEGNPAIIMVKGGKQGNSKFTRGQHYMALLDISKDGSKIFVGNSHTADRGSYSSNGWYPTSEVLTSVREATIFSKNG